MKRRKFLQSSLVAAAGAAVTITPAIAGHKSPAQKEIYEWREYEIRFGSDLAQLENYFKTALIPALNKYGVKKVGVFKEWRQSEPAKVYLLTPYSSLDEYLSVNTKVKTDTDYIKNSAAYNSIPADKPVYNRFTSSLMIAFDGFPAMVAPSAGPRIFELRTYEGYSEEAVRRKIKMFNDGEFPIFKRAKLNPVFFGEVIAGDKLPRLTYMLTCNNMEERDKGWSAFVADPEWKKLIADPQYANTISKISNTFLVPTSYSQV
ncbi:NIPSNAP family protein [Chitinophaga tropicalis]|uniref:NIPSNAP family containing protein n=1 Tax=Chitinophaga tropicalis TaxID=2683588 RepID=A0A7K1U1X4_9BACT|nr:NIPSNAP family protein [Chitinophaga tropicalis]MVT08374.1 NIPSNAP family containing protein [Chitinophaga tropicalis]